MPKVIIEHLNVPFVLDFCGEKIFTQVKLNPCRLLRTILLSNFSTVDILLFFVKMRISSRAKKCRTPKKYLYFRCYKNV